MACQSCGPRSFPAEPLDVAPPAASRALESNPSPATVVAPREADSRGLRRFLLGQFIAVLVAVLAVAAVRPSTAVVAALGGPPLFVSTLALVAHLLIGRSHGV